MFIKSANTKAAVTLITLMLATLTFSQAQAGDIDFVDNSASADFSWVDASYGNQIIALQQGNTNSIDIEQTAGSDHHLKVVQIGDANRFSIIHSGTATLQASQIGNGNVITGDLTRNNQQISITQTGNNMRAAVASF